VAPRLLGMILAHRLHSGLVLSGRIVEVEAYLGPHHAPPDPAAHSYRGPTPRNRVLWGPAGHAYVYRIYGQYFCMNICCEPAGQAGCVLLRALEPLGPLAALRQMAANRNLDPGNFARSLSLPDSQARALTSGPSRLCQALGLTREQHNALDLLSPRSPLQLRDDGFPASAPHRTPRIGIRHAVDWPLRFALKEERCVSGPARLRG
jgi:DNA-3-methyladenine glycosylase